MKSIKFTKYKVPDPGSVFTRDKYYSVWIGGPNYMAFKSEVKIKAWLSESSRFFTFKMFQFISIFSTIQKMYWDNYMTFSLENNKSNARFLAGKQIEANFILIGENLGRLSSEARRDTGLFYVISRLKNSKVLLHENCDLILKNIPRSNVATHYKFKTHLSELSLWQNQIDKFGLVKTSNIVLEELNETIPVLRKII